MVASLTLGNYYLKSARHPANYDDKGGMPPTRRTYNEQITGDFGRVIPQHLSQSHAVLIP
jgi:hypothetical protein